MLLKLTISVKEAILNIDAENKLRGVENNFEEIVQILKRVYFVNDFTSRFVRETLIRERNRLEKLARVLFLIEEK